MNNPTPISKKHVTDVCKLGQGPKTCAFLGISEGPTCLKDSELEDLIRTRLENGSMAAKGDNCSGPPDFIENKFSRSTIWNGEI